MRTLIVSLAVFVLVVAFFIQPSPAQQRAAASPADSSLKLPVRRVLLHKNSVGNFEHLGRAHGNQDVSIDFTRAQLNDGLKSLTVLDLSGGHNSGVSSLSAPDPTGPRPPKAR